MCVYVCVCVCVCKGDDHTHSARRRCVKGRVCPCERVMVCVWSGLMPDFQGVGVERGKQWAGQPGRELLPGADVDQVRGYF